jgi:hypothetical protein
LPIPASASSFAFLLGKRRDRLGLGQDHARRLAVGAHAEGIAALHLEHGGDVRERLADFGVGRHLSRCV